MHFGSKWKAQRVEAVARISNTGTSHTRYSTTSSPTAPAICSRIDVLVDASEVGTWAFHCHVLTHAEGPDGMFGMVTAMIVEE